MPADALDQLHVGVSVELGDYIILEAGMTALALIAALCLAPFTWLLLRVAHLTQVVPPVILCFVSVFSTAKLADVHWYLLELLIILFQELPITCWINA